MLDWGTVGYCLTLRVKIFVKETVILIFIIDEIIVPSLELPNLQQIQFQANSTYCKAQLYSVVSWIMNGITIIS